MAGFVIGVSAAVAVEQSGAGAASTGAPPPVVVCRFPAGKPAEATPLPADAVGEAWTAPRGTGVALGNGTLLLAADDGGVSCFVEGRPEPLAVIRPGDAGAARIVVRKAAAGKAVLEVAWAGRNDRSLTISLKRGAHLAEIAPAAGIDTLEMETAVPHWCVPGFVGDDFARSAADAKPGAPAFIPADRLLLGFHGAGDAMLFLAWPSEDPTVSSVAGANGTFNRLSMQPRGARFFLGGMARPGLWKEISLASAKIGEALRLEWAPPFDALWQATLVGPESVTSWELREEAGHKSFLVGPHGFQIPVLWAFQMNVKGNERRYDLVPPPGIVHRGEIRRALLYPIRRATKTPPDVLLPEDVLREAFDSGVCEYVQMVDWIGGRPLCGIRGTLDQLNALYAGSGRAFQLWQSHVDLMLEQGLKMYKRVRDYRSFAVEVEKLCADGRLPQTEETTRLRASIVADSRAIVEACDAALRRPMEAAHDWRDLAPRPEETPEAAMQSLAAAYHQAMLDTDADDAYGRVSDLVVKLHTLSVSPTTDLPRPRRLTQSVRNSAGSLAVHSPEAAKVAARIRTLAGAALTNMYWTEKGR